MIRPLRPKLSEWDGKERRQVDRDHDLLTRIDERLDAFIKELADLKKKVNWHDKIIYIGLGGLAVLEFLLKVK